VPILVVDDDPSKRLALRAVLLPLGLSVVEATSGQEALQSLLSQDFAVILLDVSMPDMDGFETAALIRQRRESELTPIIFITSHPSDKIRMVDRYSGGAVDFLFAPLQPDELRAKVSVFASIFVNARLLASQARELEAANRELVAISRRDPLTGLGNRRALQEDLEVLEGRVIRYGHRYCMALFDVDHFKTYNDRYGHQAGDQVLERVAAQLKGQARTGDTLYRYGGEEFLCILPEQSLATGVIAAQRMRGALEALTIPHVDNPPGVLTVSAGVAVMDPDGATTAAEVLKQADEALYRAKRLGRNRVEHLGSQAA
jgi:two-component system cell cycle response regulator